MYEMISNPFVSRTLATLRSAEFGFFGVVVYTRVQTPRRCGPRWSAGDFDLTVSVSRPWRTSWLIVGMRNSFRCSARVRGACAPGRTRRGFGPQTLAGRGRKADDCIPARG